MTTKIEWADVTWNPVTGCSKISDGCVNCYAERMARRLAGRYGYPKEKPFRPTVHENLFRLPFKWKKPRRIFVCSMGDLFHSEVGFETIDVVIQAAALNRRHTFLLLTKRPDRMENYFNDLKTVHGAMRFSHPRGVLDMALHAAALEFRRGLVLDNVWLGITAENQEQANIRIPKLLRIRAAVRFVSIEPMLGPVDLFSIPRFDNAYFMQREEIGCIGPETEPDDYVYWCKKGIHWVICGGETGLWPSARMMDVDWARALRDQCKAARLPFFFKQWGSWAVRGKNPAARLLDGREWNEFPEVAA